MFGQARRSSVGTMRLEGAKPAVNAVSLLLMLVAGGLCAPGLSSAAKRAAIICGLDTAFWRDILLAARALRMTPYDDGKTSSHELAAGGLAVTLPRRRVRLHAPS